jgi:uncharacterized protein (DUF885 family)
MNRMLLGGLMLAALVLGPLAQARAQGQNADADARFKTIYTQEWAWRSGASSGPRGRALPDNSRLDTVDAKSQQERLSYWTHVLSELDALDVKALSPANQVNYAVYHRQIANFVSDGRFKTWQMPFNSDSAFWSDLYEQLGGDQLRSVADYRAYLQKLAQVPRYFAQEEADMRLGLARGFSVPRAVLDGRDRSIAEEAQRKNPTNSPYYKPFRQMPGNIPKTQAEALRERARRVIARQLTPAYARLLVFFDHVYLPRARTTLAAESLPDGKAYYRQQILQYTTLNLGPDAIHSIGLREVARIHAKMLRTMRATGFNGSFFDFLTYLRTNPRFYARTSQELLDKTAWVTKEVDGQLSRLFGHLPRERFTIEPVPAGIAPYYTSGRGGPSVYLVNTYDLKSRPLYDMPALTLHESYPGHALQLELASEANNQPAFRRDGYISAYGEGWALYSEYLGNVMGIYKTPYQRFGFLTYQMWRACRLVVDTGIHHMGWSRQKAINYMLANTALSRREIENEVDRYISWPGQALSYELGYMEIRRLRAKAEKALGSNFNIRAFHDTVLSTGSVPLPVLARRIDRFIAEGGPEPAFSCDCAKR